MGWFWNSAPSAPNATTASTSEAPKPAAAPAPREQPSGDREVQKFWEMIQEEVNPSQAAQAKPTPPSAAPSPPSPPPTAPTSSSWFSWARAPDNTTSKPTTSARPEQQVDPTTRAPRRDRRSPESRAMSEAVLPTTMSCRDAFDYAWHCHTPAAQWNAVYRYGSVRSCSELWDDFWFCMRTKSFSDEARAEAIKAHYRAKEEAKYGGGQPSSEDVWESRKELVAPGTAFQAKFDPPIADDLEFQKSELERRRRIREELEAQGRKQ
ncbi:hypothetical protein QBC47DRAFT_370270 [Echria macrotheca]|uniref:Early meiotic induction protein 1 n=1 Tax=Echria macrotheca TaxID=438768 RepID=A0AAJ0BT13_9PEZI|nr:hypothetical protein QBC47DRAFT_370270 [Echria macrotheca]